MHPDPVPSAAAPKNPPADPIQVVADNNQPSIAVPPPTPFAEPASVVAKPAQRRLAKPFSYPALMALPAKIAIPLNEHDRDLLNLSFLPCSNLSGPKKFNAFITFCNHSENHAVLVSRAFPSTTISVQGAYLAIRQVLFIAATTTSSSTELTCTIAVPFLSALLVSLEFSERNPMLASTVLIGFALVIATTNGVILLISCALRVTS